MLALLACIGLAVLAVPHALAVHVSHSDPSSVRGSKISQTSDLAGVADLDAWYAGRALDVKTSSTTLHMLAVHLSLWLQAKPSCRHRFAQYARGAAGAGPQRTALLGRRKN